MPQTRNQSRNQTRSQTRSVILSAATIAASLAPASASTLPDRLVGDLLAGPDPERLAEHHRFLASEPHDAGTPGDRRVIGYLEQVFNEAGLEVETHELSLYLATPVSASVEILPDGGDPIGLSIREEAVEGDPYSGRDGLRPGWNAYAGSGLVEAEVVYANYGRLEDFERLDELGVDCAGKIVIARYGGNYRGYKAKYAEAAGASGLLIYTDPADSGWGRGLSWPEGGYANETHIQRGSIKTLDYYGDPLTPFVEATADAERLDPADVGLPTIPVQPLPWKSAQQILIRMSGEEAPGDWQGGLPMRYRVAGGGELRVRLEVEQTRGMVETANVLGTLRGSTHPEEAVIIGCHHDAWGFGASDPTAGLICVVEAARVMGEMAKNGWEPARSIVFAGWAAEEHGIVGSVEYVESRPEWLTENAVAYLNLDMAAMGPNFRSAASPSLRSVIAEAAKLVPQPGGDEGVMVWNRWTGKPVEPGRLDVSPETTLDLPTFGSLGGGSDHVGFLCHVCIPCASMGGGGSRGTSYHSLYDNLAWYHAVVGDDYEPARMVTRMTTLTAAMLAEEGAGGLMPAFYAEAAHAALDRIEENEDVGWARELRLIHEPIRDAAAAFEKGVLRARLVKANFRGVSRVEWERSWAYPPELNSQIERSWCDGRFDDGRAWYRNGFAAPDATSGYASWILPGLRAALQAGDEDGYRAQAEAYASWFREWAEQIAEATETED